MELGEPAGRATPTRPKLSPAGATLAGIISGPTGTLGNWPFALLRNGDALGPDSLGGGHSSNPYRDGCWWSSATGEFRFESMPEGCFELEVLLPGARLQPRDPHPAAVEDGERARTPEPVQDGTTLATSDFSHIAP